MPRPLFHRVAVLLAVPGLLGTAACAPVEDTTDGSAGPEQPETTLTVFAAASLTESFEQLATGFEQANPHVSVEFNFAGSSDLAAQIGEGAPADVFASANTATMDLVVDEAGVAGEPETFAQNVLEIAVPADNPAGIEGFDDLADDGVKVALCAEEVPCGAASDTVMTATGVRIEPVTREKDVKAALTKVQLGEVDAALVYRTDVIAAGGTVQGIGFPETEQAVNDYPIAVLADAPNAGPAADWVALVTSDEGASVLADAGFRTP
ncbi:molybdate ABC transporter substrate-binding protein [Nocardiopsis ansamitocini]|uniref:Molybdate-binding protein n=1 Tax=Nocardiopsis ansamitocini TaxID=1670832 RepID=A0A9W6P5Q0_9ACTN|nr:molybdate ABC transporter substrate-binding protein [Nocardiopsis ansamitocini]GLU47544.1 molybdate-binding protein [Nocardiopsis ansamitocini]